MLTDSQYCTIDAICRQERNAGAEASLTDLATIASRLARASRT